ncbi:MAG: DegV family protein [Lachnospiraceae bacterium]|jgi:DegV family protein with EDD domain|nr:DegV family protein [Lachnospiraceae bacterium]
MSNKISIFTDSASELVGDLIPDNVKVVPLTVCIDERPQSEDLEKAEFYRMLENGHKVSTSAVNPDAFERAFRPELEKGNDIFFAGIASSLSSTYANACIAKETLAGEFPDRVITVIDSRSVSWGEGQMMLDIAKAGKAGATMEELVAMTEDKDKYCHYFAITDNMERMKDSGRFGVDVLRGISMLLRMTPLMHFSKKDALSLVKLARTKKQMFEWFVGHVTKNYSADPQAGDKGTNEFVIAYGGRPDDKDKLVEMIPEEYRGTLLHGPQYRINPVIASHTGGAVLAVFYRGARV